MLTNLFKNIALLFLLTIGVQNTYAQDSQSDIDFLKELQSGFQKGVIHDAIKAMKDSSGINIYPTFHIADDSALWPYALELYFNVRIERKEPYLLVTLNLEPSTGKWTDFSQYGVSVSLTQGQKKVIPSAVLIAAEKQINEILDNITNLREYFGKIKNNIAETIEKLRYSMRDKYWQGKDLPLVTFYPVSDQQFGFDQPLQQEIIAKYKNFYRYDTITRVPWKALSTTKTDKINAFIQIRDTSFKKSHIRFINRSDAQVQPMLIKGDTLVFQLTGISKDQDDEVTAEYFDNDDTGKERKAPIGQIKTITYEEETNIVHIVPVNNAKYPGTKEELEAYLNNVYKQAVAKWNVVFDKSINIKNWDLDGDNILNIETAVFQRYSDEEQLFVDVLEKQSNYDPKAAYLFITDISNNLNARGYMPLSAQYGFIFSKETQTVHNEVYHNTVGHELGHGVYKLQHPWDEYGTPERQTNNLLDYQFGSALWKPQWDWIHDPGLRLYMFQKAAEGASTSNPCLAQKITDEMNLFSQTDLSKFLADDVSIFEDNILKRFEDYTGAPVYIYIPSNTKDDEVIFKNLNEWESCTEKGLLIFLNLKNYLVNKNEARWVYNLRLQVSSGVAYPFKDSLYKVEILIRKNLEALLTGNFASDRLIFISQIELLLQKLKNHSRVDKDIYLKKGSDKYSDNNVIPISNSDKIPEYEVVFNYDNKLINYDLLEIKGSKRRDNNKIYVDLTSVTGSHSLQVIYDRTDTLEVSFTIYEPEFSRCSEPSTYPPSGEVNFYGYDEMDKGNWANTGHNVFVKKNGYTYVQVKCNDLLNMEFNSADKSVQGILASKISNTKYNLKITASQEGKYDLIARLKGTSTNLGYITVYVVSEKNLQGNIYSIGSSGITVSSLEQDANLYLKHLVTKCNLGTAISTVSNYDINGNSELDVFQDTDEATEMNLNYEADNLYNLNVGRKNGDGFLCNNVNKAYKLRQSVSSGSNSIYVNISAGNLIKQTQSSYYYKIYNPATHNHDSNLEVTSVTPVKEMIYDLTFDKKITVKKNSRLFIKHSAKLLYDIDKESMKIYLQDVNLPNTDISKVNEFFLCNSSLTDVVKIEFALDANNKIKGEVYDNGRQSVVELKTKLGKTISMNGYELIYYLDDNKVIPFDIIDHVQFSYSFYNDWMNNLGKGDYKYVLGADFGYFKLLDVVQTNKSLFKIVFNKTLREHLLTGNNTTEPYIYQYYKNGNTIGGLSGFNHQDNKATIMITSTGMYSLVYTHEKGHSIFDFADIKNVSNIMNCNTGWSIDIKIPYRLKEQITVETGCGANKGNESQWKLRMLK